MSTHQFNQSEAVTRCRGYKESKLRGQYALAKLVDEEVTIHAANLDEGRNQLMTQQYEQRSFDNRQEAEAEDFRTGRERKIQFTALVDKLSALKLLLRFQEDNRESETAFKLSIRHKRAAFQVQLARLEKRQVAERKELFSAQARLSETAATIRHIEVINMKDQKLARALKRKHAIMDQQNQMKQQKESQFLREIQLCKTRQLQQLTELDISNAEEMQEIMAAHKAEEFDMIAKQKIIEAQNEAILDKQLAEAQALHMLERQKIVKIQLQRAQRKQKAELERAQKASARVREKTMLAENPIILNSTTSGLSNGSGNADDAASDTSRSQSISMSATSTTQEGSTTNEETTDENSEDVEENGQNIAIKNSQQNKNAGGHVLSDEEKELAAMLEVGRERNRATQNHHKNLIKELKSQQKSQITLKTRDHKRKVAELLKEQQEEMEQLKNDQEQTMQELLSNQTITEDVNSTDDSNGVVVQLMPDHVRADITMGNSPEPAKFDAITMACIEIDGFAELCTSVGPENSFTFARAVEESIEKALSKTPELFKVKFERGACILASGLNKDKIKGFNHCGPMTNVTIEFVQNLMEELPAIHCPGTPEGSKIHFKASIHTGPATGGLIGTTFSVYHLMGPNVHALRQLCASSLSGHVQVSSNSKEYASADDYEFEERGVVEVEGFGKVNTFWLK
jgi:hypothetical protein